MESRRDMCLNQKQYSRWCRRTAGEKITNMSDNITVVSYVNNKGGIKSEFCNKIA